jgi:BirA family biotin operon repressor/biotin-[acetyl-CoA-carboxylase] ligase
LIQALRAFEQFGFAPLRDAFHTRDVLFGKEVVCSDGTTGLARGVDAFGALLVQTPQGVQKINTAEVSVRPVASPLLG